MLRARRTASSRRAIVSSSERESAFDSSAMSDDPPGIPHTFPYDPAKARTPFTPFMIPDAFVPYLAQVAVLWGAFENDFEAFLQALFSANKTEPKGWRFWSFEQKNGFFLDQSRALFVSHPTALEHLTRISTDATPLQIKRNVLLHGHIWLKIITDEAANPTVSLEATGRRKGRIIVENFTLDVLENLYFDLCHLNGRVTEFRRVDPDKSFPDVASPDRRFLLDFLFANHPAHSKPPTHPPPPRSFPE